MEYKYGSHAFKEVLRGFNRERIYFMGYSTMWLRACARAFKQRNEKKPYVIVAEPKTGMLPSPLHGVKLYNVTSYYVCKWHKKRLLRLKIQCYSELYGMIGYNRTEFHYYHNVLPWYKLWNVLFKSGDETNFELFTVFGRNTLRQWSCTVVRHGMPMEFDTQANKDKIDFLLKRTSSVICDNGYRENTIWKNAYECLQLAKSSLYDLRAFHYKFQKDNLIRCIKRVGL